MSLIVSHHWHVEVEIFNVQCHILCSAGRHHTIDEYLDQCQVRSWSTDISWIVNFVAANCKSCSVYFGLVWLYFTNKFGVGYIFPPVFWYFVFVDEKYCISALDSATYSLRKSSKFVGGGMHPYFTMFWVSY